MEMIMDKCVTVKISVEEPTISYEKDTQWERLENYAGIALFRIFPVDTVSIALGKRFGVDHIATTITMIFRRKMSKKFASIGHRPH